MMHSILHLTFVKFRLWAIIQLVRLQLGRHAPLAMSCPLRDSWSSPWTQSASPSLLLFGKPKKRMASLPKRVSRQAIIIKMSNRHQERETDRPPSFFWVFSSVDLSKKFTLYTSNKKNLYRLHTKDSISIIFFFTLFLYHHPILPERWTAVSDPSQQIFLIFLKNGKLETLEISR